MDKMSMETTGRYRVAYLVSHPIQYQAPLLRYIATHSQKIDLMVYFLSDFSLRSYKDTGFGATVSWDIPLLEGYQSEFLPAWGKTEPLSSIRPFSIGIAERLRKGKFDALWMHGYAHLTHLRAMTVAKQLNIPVMLRADTQAGGVIRKAGTKHIKEAFLRLIFSKADAFLSVGKRNADYYREYGAPDSRIFSMPYVVDNDFFASESQKAHLHREDLRASLQLEPGRPIILYASKFQARKRAGDLLDAYIRLSPDGRTEPKPYLLFVGDGEDRVALETKAKATNWDSIRFLGFKNQTELPALFDLCDVFVLASAKEPWALIVNEVMNAGKALIVSDGVGAADDLVGEGDNGFVVPVGDIAVLADRLRQLTIDEGAAERVIKMGKRSLERISEWTFHEDLVGLEAALDYCCRPKRTFAAPNGSK